jgi:hypothetical protein
MIGAMGISMNHLGLFGLAAATAFCAYACTLDCEQFKGNDVSAGGSSAGGNNTGATSAGGTGPGPGGSTMQSSGGGGAGGSAQGGGGAGQGGTGGQGGLGGAGGGGPICPVDGTPPGTVDPGGIWSCNNGNKRCTLDCNTQDECNAATGAIVCPPGWDCRVRCRAQAACQANTINCPDDYACLVECEAQDACEDTIINCGTATCDVACTDEATACGGNSVVNCVAGYECSMTCNSGAAPTTVNNCMDACECTEC